MAKLTACRECKYFRRAPWHVRFFHMSFEWLDEKCYAKPRMAYDHRVGTKKPAGFMRPAFINTDGHCKFFEQKEEENVD